MRDSPVIKFLNQNITALSVTIALLLASLGLMLNSALQERMETEIASKTAIAAEGLRAALESQISEITHLSESFEALIEADPDFVATEFDHLASILLRDRPEVMNIAIAPNLVIERVYPTAPNQGVIGLNLLDLTQGDFVKEAIEHDATLFEGPVQTVQGPTAFITRTPIRFGTSQTEEPWGMVSIVVLAEAIFEYPLEMQASGDFEILILRPGKAAPIFGEQIERVYAPNISTLSRDGFNWEVKVYPTDKLVSAIAWDESTLLIAFALLCIPIVGLLIFYARHMKIVGRLRSLLADSLNAIDDGFVIYDADDRFVLCNDAYRRIYSRIQDMFVPGVTYEAIVREGVKRGQYAEAIGREDEFIEQRLTDHNDASRTIMQKLPDGTWLKVAERMTADGARVGIRVDITELEEARAAAEEAFQVKSEFISVLSHELRTPLTVILGYAKVLANVGLLKSARQLESAISKDVPSEAEMSEAFEALLQQVSGQAKKMESSGSHLLTLINDLLDYSKIEQGHFKLKLEEFSLKSVLSSVVEDMSDMAFQKGISLEDESRDMTIIADKIRFKQVMINLIGNAIKFTDVGCVVVSTSFREGEIEVSVADTGQGIPQDKLNMIFDAFQQADLSDRRAAGGTGLGLAISKSIVEMHSGQINVTSELGRGSTFTVKMPLEALVETPRFLERMSRPLMSA